MTANYIRFLAYLVSISYALVFLMPRLNTSRMHQSKSVMHSNARDGYDSLAFDWLKFPVGELDHLTWSTSTEPWHWGDQPLHTLHCLSQLFRGYWKVYIFMWYAGHLLHKSQEEFAVVCSVDVSDCPQLLISMDCSCYHLKGAQDEKLSMSRMSSMVEYIAAAVCKASM